MARERLIKAWVGYCFGVLLTTEILSFFNILTREVLIVVYCLAAGLGLFLGLRKLKRKPIKLKLNKADGFIIGLAVATIVIPLIFIAWYYPSNGWDSMTYHLSRIHHWIQNRNVDYYPTNNQRQLYSGPMTEYVILHFMLLKGNDLLANFVQFTAMILTVLTATLLVKEWKGNRRTQLLAAILVLTIPMGILQATGTQSDYMTAFFLMAAIYFSLKNEWLFLALSIGLGMLTKSTFLIFICPFGVYWLYRWWRTDGIKMIKKIVLILSVVIIINGFQVSRNYRLYGLATGPLEASALYINESFEPKYLISNITRSVGLQIGLPWLSYNSKIDQAVSKIHEVLGLTTNDPKNTFLDTKYHTLFIIDEGGTGNIMVTLLSAAAVIMLLIKRNKAGVYFGLVLMSWLLFNAVLKWNPWQTRLELPLMAAVCPVVAVIFDKYLRHKFILRYLMLVLIVLSWPFVAGNMIVKWIEPVWGSSKQLSLEMFKIPKTRTERYFTICPECYQIHSKLAKVIAENNISNVGLDLEGNSWEYPWWVLLKESNKNVELSYIRQPAMANGRNYNKNWKYRAIIYDSMGTEELFDKEDIEKVVNISGIGVIILKNETDQVFY